MNKMNIFTTYKNLITAKNKYDKLCEQLENQLKDKIEFNFGIEYQPSDGFCIINIDNDDLSQLSDCLSIIKIKGTLTIDDFNEYGI